MPEGLLPSAKHRRVGRQRLRLQDVLEYMALNESGGELFKGGFRKLFKLEQNPLNETQSEIQLAKI